MPLPTTFGCARVSAGGQKLDLHDTLRDAGCDDVFTDTISGATSSRPERRETPIPAEAPQALTPTFANDAGKRQQWTAFLRRTGLAAETLGLSAVIDTLRDFLLPPLSACARSLAFDRKWKPGGPWRGE